MDAEGRLPQELARPRSFHYTIYVLDALIRAARIGEKAGVDLWNYTGPDGQSLSRALDFIVPYILGDKKWPYAQIKAESEESFAPMLLYAAKVYGKETYMRAAKKLLEHNKAYYLNLLININ